MDDLRQVLREIFPTLSEGALLNLERTASILEFPPMVTLCREGEVEDSFFILLSGEVEVHKVMEGQMLLINRLRPGAHFGDIALLLDMPRTATIITGEATQALRVDRATLQALFTSAPEVVVALSQLIIRRFLAQEEKLLLEIARLKKKDTLPARVFVSYARSDQKFVTRLANNLLRHKIDVWLDLYRLDAGKSWARQVGSALDTCQVMLLVLSPASIASDNTEDEWNYYLDNKKPVVVVRHLPCKVPYRLSKLQYIDFHEVDYEQALARVAATLNTLYPAPL